jgi:hypothetical protein
VVVCERAVVPVPDVAVMVTVLVPAGVPDDFVEELPPRPLAIPTMPVNRRSYGCCTGGRIADGRFESPVGVAEHHGDVSACDAESGVDHYEISDAVTIQVCGCDAACIWPRSASKKGLQIGESCSTGNRFWMARHGGSPPKRDCISDIAAGPAWSPGVDTSLGPASGIAAELTLAGRGESKEHASR